MDTACSRECQRTLLATLVLVELGLVLLYLGERLVGSPFWILHRLLDLDGEQSLGAWFSTLQLFAVGAVVLAKARDPGSLARLGPAFLYLVGLAFVFLSADEALSIHESITEGLKRVAWLPRFEGGHGIWMPLYLATVVAFAVASRRRVQLLWREFRGAALFLFGGFALFLGGAAGVELIGYQFVWAQGSLALAVEVAVEEALEMAGISVVLVGALRLAAEEQSVSTQAAAQARPAPTP
jgi:hypothetical protein